MTDIVDVDSSSSSLVEQQQADLDDDVNDADFEPSLDVSLLPKVMSLCLSSAHVIVVIGREEQDQGAQEEPVRDGEG